MTFIEILRYLFCWAPPDDGRPTKPEFTQGGHKLPRLLEALPRPPRPMGQRLSTFLVAPSRFQFPSSICVLILLNCLWLIYVIQLLPIFAISLLSAIRYPFHFYRQINIPLRTLTIRDGIQIFRIDPRRSALVKNTAPPQLAVPSFLDGGSDEEHHKKRQPNNHCPDLRR
ncbi:hypothetical protein BD779DRAFT_326757 [Infundibulicybe gibba]|nr:hypothetical protein BD779DRAFT_326757 [Infundibulicybe gibba]